MKTFFKISPGPGRIILILLFSTSSLYAQWDSAKLSLARKNLAAASVGNKALFAGGNNQTYNGNTNVYYKRVDIYDYTTGQWTSGDFLREARQSLRATSFGSKAFFAGGVLLPSGYSNVVDVYDEPTNTWSWFELKTRRSYIGIAAADGKVFFGGGQVSSSYTKEVEVWSVNSEYDTTIEMRVPRGYLSAVALGTEVFFAGGLGNNGQATDDVDIYDTNTKSWKYTDLPSGARSHLTAVAYGTKVFFAGGRAGSSPSDAVDIYDTVLGDWLPSSPTRKLSEPRGQLHSAAIGDSVFFAGGYAGAPGSSCDVNLSEVVEKTSSTFDIFDGNTGEFLHSTNLPGGKRFSLAATNVGATQVVFAGGAGPCDRASVAADIYDLDPLIIQTNFPEELSPSDKVGVTVDDVSRVESVKVHVRGVSNPDGDFNPVDVIPSGSSYDIGPDLSDEIGVDYFFEINDSKYDRTRWIDTVTSYNRYPEGSPRLAISGIRNGNKESDYQIISVPLMLDERAVPDVFDELNDYNIKKWRLYDYHNEQNREYPGFTTIEPGKGYWLITKDLVTLSTGAGSTSRKARGEEFELTLPNGWSLIGNPYNFTISWAAVKDYNEFSESQKIKTFSNGILDEEDELEIIDKQSGAFVYNSSEEITLRIPVKRDPDLDGNRIKIQEEIDLDAPNWQLKLELTDGSLRNRLGGIGMNKKATLTGLDDFDGLAVPMTEGIGMPGLIFMHPETKLNFSREVVPTNDEYIWDMDIQRGTEKTLTLNWNNELFKETQKQLFLYDPSSLHMVDMKIKNSYTLPPNASNLQVMMGGPEFMNKKRDELMPLFGYPYPNPSSDKLNIPFWIPAAEGEMEIMVKVYNMVGAEIKAAGGSYQSGQHELVLNVDGMSGMYLVHMKANGQHNKWTKVTVR